MATGACEEPVVEATGDRGTSCGPAHRIAPDAAPATVGHVVEEQPDEARGGRLFSDAVVLLTQPDRGALRVDVTLAEVEGAPGAGLEVEPDEEQVEVGVAAGSPDGVGEVGELPVVEGTPSAGVSASP